MFDKQDRTGKNCYESYFDGKRHETLKAKYENGSKILFVQLYYDGVGITNPIGFSVGSHSTSVFYVTFLNLPAHMNAAIANVHLVALCNSRFEKST